MESDTLLQILLSGGLVTALAGAYVSMRRLPREQQSAAITDSTMANESLVRLVDRLEAENTRLEEDRDYWCARAKAREEDILKRYGYSLPPDE